MSKLIDIKNLSNQMSEIKNPLIFLFLLDSYISKIDDYNLSLILRVFLKYHTQVALEVDLKSLWLEDFIDYPKSWSVLNDFYDMINKKIFIVLHIQKWNQVYDNNIFWKQPLEKQIEHLNNMKTRFLAIYDCSRGGAPFHLKLVGFSDCDKNNNYKLEIFNDIQYRLETLLQIFGLKIFKALNIPLMPVSQFHNESYQNIITYLNIIFDRINVLIEQTTKIFEYYSVVCLQLDNIVNPIVINIKSSHIDSDTEHDDIAMMSKP